MNIPQLYRVRKNTDASGPDRAVVNWKASRAALRTPKRQKIGTKSSRVTPNRARSGTNIGAYDWRT